MGSVWCFCLYAVWMLNCCLCVCSPVCDFVHSTWKMITAKFKAWAHDMALYFRSAMQQQPFRLMWYEAPHIQSQAHANTDEISLDRLLAFEKIALDALRDAGAF